MTITDTSPALDIAPPVEAYLARAANCGTDMPVDVQLNKILSEQAQRLWSPAAFSAAFPADTEFFSDVSKYQDVLDSTYHHSVVSCRISSGWSVDSHASDNWRVAKRSKKIEIFIGYVVYIPGRIHQILDDVKSVFGSKCPNKVVLMIDMESGSGFAGAGDHSAGANALRKLLADYAGSPKRVIGYANHYDWIENWSDHPKSMRRITASYSTTDPGTWGWQYYGGMPYASPAGYPRHASPFGYHVDMNVVHRSLKQMKRDLGIDTPDVAPHKPGPKPKPKYKTYRVREGDTMIEIAERHDVGWQQLVTWNERAYPSLRHHPDLIKIGWTLRVSK